MTMPLTLNFVSDCSTETYTEAKEREHSRKHEQATFVPITLLDGAMINLIKTQKNTDGEYTIWNSLAKLSCLITR